MSAEHAASAASAAAASSDDVDDRVCTDVPPPPRRPFPREKLFQPHNGLPDLDALCDHLHREGRLHIPDLIELVRRVGDVMRREPNLLRLADPITVCGDVHGQFYDLLRLFEVGGSPAETQYLFLGDYVDRGCFSTECVIYLYALKLTFPTRFFLLRGNHECRQLTAFFNFKDECKYKYSLEVYDEIMNSFDTLPLSAIINDKFLCIHGGLSPDVKTLHDIEAINRFMEVPRAGPMCDLLWSDPVDDEHDDIQDASDAADSGAMAGGSGSGTGGDDEDDGDYDEEETVTLFAYNRTRQCSFIYGVDAVEQFLDDNNLTSLIRAHEAQLEGYKMQMVNAKSGIPRVITIFSAPNYCDVYKNKAACIEFNNNLLNIRQFVCSPHPYYLPNFMDVFEWSLPFVAEKVTDMLASVMAFNSTHDSDEEEAAGASAASDDTGVLGMNKEQVSLAQAMLKKRGGTLRQKVVAVAKLARVFAILRQEKDNCVKLKQLTPNNKLPFGLLREGKEAITQVLTSFEQARDADRVNERMPSDGKEPLTSVAFAVTGKRASSKKKLVRAGSVTGIGIVRAGSIGSGVGL